jgi:hypothetical protein
LKLSEIELEEKKTLESEIIKTRQMLKELEEIYYEKYLKNEGD